MANKINKCVTFKSIGSNEDISIFIISPTIDVVYYQQLGNSGSVEKVGNEFKIPDIIPGQPLLVAFPYQGTYPNIPELLLTFGTDIQGSLEGKITLLYEGPDIVHMYYAFIFVPPTNFMTPTDGKYLLDVNIP